MNPSFLMTCTAQSIDPLYLTASPDVIIMRRRIVSIGYEIRPDVIVTTEAGASSDTGRGTGMDTSKGTSMDTVDGV